MKSSSLLIVGFAVLASIAMVGVISIIGCSNRPVPIGESDLDEITDSNKDSAEQPSGDAVETADSDATEVVTADQTETSDQQEATDQQESTDASEAPLNTEEEIQAAFDELNKPPVGPQTVKKITFDDLELKKMEPDDIFRLAHLEDDVKKLIGGKVRISGVIHAGTLMSNKNIKEFVMIINSECKFGRGGTAWHNIRVQLKDGPPLKYTTKPVTVEGDLKLSVFEGVGEDGKPATWSIYVLVGKQA